MSGLLLGEVVPRMLQLENRASEGMLTGVLDSLSGEKEGGDLVLVCSDQQVVKSHRGLLGLWSPVLRPLLGVSQSSLLLLPAFTSRAVEGVLSLLQGGWGEDNNFTLSQDQVDLLAGLGVHPGSMAKIPTRKVVVACHVCGRKVLDLKGHMQLLHRDYEPPSEREAENKPVAKRIKEDCQKDNSVINEIKRKPLQEAFVGAITSILKSKQSNEPMNEAYLFNSVFEPNMIMGEKDLDSLETAVKKNHPHMADNIVSTFQQNMNMVQANKTYKETGVANNYYQIENILKSHMIIDQAMEFTKEEDPHQIKIKQTIPSNNRPEETEESDTPTKMEPDMLAQKIKNKLDRDLFQSGDPVRR